MLRLFKILNETKTFAIYFVINFTLSCVVRSLQKTPPQTDGAGGGARRSGPVRREPMAQTKYVITISRQFASMGRSIAQELARQLGQQHQQLFQKLFQLI